MPDFQLGTLAPDERARQWEVAHKAAADAGRDPSRLAYTRWGSIDMPTAAVEALAAQGVTRVVVSAASADPAEQRDQLSAFAERFGLC